MPYFNQFYRLRIINFRLYFGGWVGSENPPVSERINRARSALPGLFSALGRLIVSLERKTNGLAHRKCSANGIRNVVMRERPGSRAAGNEMGN